MAGLGRWVRWLGRTFPEIKGVWLFGSWASGTELPSSDVDVMIVADEIPAGFAARGTQYLPAWADLPLELFVYTPQETDRLAAQKGTIPWAARTTGRCLLTRP